MSETARSGLPAESGEAGARGSSSPAFPACPERVYSGSRDVVGHTCARPVKDEGLCGVHLAGLRKRRENDAKREAARVEHQQIANAFNKEFGRFGLNVGSHIEGGREWWYISGVRKWWESRNA